jgi:hypothetical protein
VVSRANLAKGLALLFFVFAVAGSWPHNVSAAQITNRSLTLETGASGDAGSKPGGSVKDELKFTVTVGSNVGSIVFNYCLTAADVGAATCVIPTGLHTTSATLDAQSGATGFSMVNTTDGSPYITRSAAVIGSSPNNNLDYILGHITNPTTTNQTFYVRISTYSSTNGTGSAIDTGVVAASTATQIVLTGIMPESLIFCTGGAINTTSGFPDCSTATSGAVSFDRLFSPSDTAVATSQMSASTNAGGGYAISIFGLTLTSGSDTIPAMTSAGGSIRNTGQFGLNLRANTTAVSSPAFGADIAPSSNTTNYRGQPLAGYNTADTFKFQSGNNIADSGNAVAGPSDSQIYTSSYIVNVAGSQPPGTYTTTLTYICTPTF